jgi:hypothetical protein
LLIPSLLYCGGTDRSCYRIPRKKNHKWKQRRQRRDSSVRRGLFVMRCNTSDMQLPPPMKHSSAHATRNNYQKGVITMKRLVVLLALLALILLPKDSLLAHCDTMNGPVVKAAQKALETGDVNLVFIWVQKNDEAQIKEAFQKTLAVRKLSPEAKKLADMYFFETLVRVHRAGEGVAYTGLKPAETQVDPGIEAADKALEKGSAEELLKYVTDEVHHGIREQFTNAMAKKNFKKDDVAAGREYVKTYVEFIHYIERLYQAAKQPAEGHYHESPSGATHDVH